MGNDSTPRSHTVVGEPGRVSVAHRLRHVRQFRLPDLRTAFARTRFARRLALVACGAALAAWGATPASGQPVATGPTAISAQLQQPGGDSAVDLVHIAGRAIHATPGYFYVQGQDTTRAYTLDPGRPAPTSDTTWHAVPLNTGGLHGVATTLWMLHGRLPGRPLPGGLEAAARQIAIWAKGVALPIDPATVPNHQLLRRALRLARAAPNNYSATPQPTALALSAFVEHVSGNTVEVMANVTDEKEDTFNDSQRIDLRIGGRWGTVRTHSQWDVNPQARGKTLAVHRSGAAPDNNTLIARILHITGVTQLELFWNVNLNSGIAMMPNGDAPAIITADPIKLGMRETLMIGTATVATGSGANWLLGLGAGWVSALLAALGLWRSVRRKPTLRAAWNTYDDAVEVADVTVVAGQRAIELYEIGLVFSWGPPLRRQRHHLRGATQRELPALLQDGASVETSFELEATIDDLHLAIGESARLIAAVRPYVRASGEEFCGRVLAPTPWARPRPHAMGARSQAPRVSAPASRRLRGLAPACRPRWRGGATRVVAASRAGADGARPPIYLCRGQTGCRGATAETTICGT